MNLDIRCKFFCQNQAQVMILSSSNPKNIAKCLVFDRDFFPPARAGVSFLHVKPEMHYISIFHNILLAFYC
jgi:hypothetical protein